MYKKEQEVASTYVAVTEDGEVVPVALTLPSTSLCDGVLRVTVLSATFS